MPSKKRATPVSLQPLDALFGTNEQTTNEISEIAIGSLHPFTNHPFQVRDDKKMEYNYRKYEFDFHIHF